MSTKLISDKNASSVIQVSQNVVLRYEFYDVLRLNTTSMSENGQTIHNSTSSVHKYAHNS